MALGFTDLTATQRIPDKAMSRQTKPKRYVANFGDGYEQRIAQGINPLDQTYSVTFNTRPKAEIDDIVAFFDSKKGVTNFAFTIPDTNGSGNETTIKVICEDYSISYDYDDYYSCNATLKRVYEP
jgi:phage-related protein